MDGMECGVVTDLWQFEEGKSGSQHQWLLKETVKQKCAVSV
jgi:hypothetical protein